MLRFLDKNMDITTTHEPFLKKQDVENKAISEAH